MMELYGVLGGAQVAGRGPCRALSCAGLSFGDCVAAPVGLNGG